MTNELISPDLKTILRRLRLSQSLDARRDSLAISLRVQKASWDPTMHWEAWDPSAKVTFDGALLNELTSSRFVESYAHVAVVEPVSVGKKFLAYALGHIACRRGAHVPDVRPEQMLKTLKQAARSQLRGRAPQDHRRRPVGPG